MADILTVLLLVSVVLFPLFFKKYQGYHRTQDVVRYKKIHKNGLIEMPDLTYRLVLEALPINLGTKSFKEQEMVWETFKEMLNVVNVESTFLVQSRHLTLQNYMAELEKQHEKVSWPGLDKVFKKQKEHLKKIVSSTSVKEHKYYIILEFNPNVAQSNLQIENATAQKILSKFSKQKIDKKNALALAEQELGDATNIALNYLSRIGVRGNRVGRLEIIETMYVALNRELAARHPLKEMLGDRILSQTTKHNG